MRPAALSTLVLLGAVPSSFALQSSVTSAPKMKALATPSRPPVTMEWNSVPVAALAVSTSMSMPSPTSMGAEMTMSDGSVMSMTATKASMSGMSPSMTGMTMSGSASKLGTDFGCPGLGMAMVSLGTGIGFLLGMI
ncbi:hypothetical protein GQ44DRAFT_759404 [Phaeosphaeriaceae sp. PMI808]|nr:hypothetical protein GQ44DRAFT_759404 [Phaeosphaeriaceae sp. PMI808]